MDDDAQRSPLEYIAQEIVLQYQRTGQVTQKFALAKASEAAERFGLQHQPQLS